MILRTTLLAALVAATPALAATPIDETRPLAADGRVSIDNVKGRIVVRTWDRAEVRVTGSLGDGVEKLEVQGDPSALTIRVRYPEGGGWFGWGGGGKSDPSVVEVDLPRQASVEVDGVSADIDVTGTGGQRLSVDSVSGDMRIVGARAPEVRLNSVSGDIIAEVETRDLTVDAVSGDIDVRGRITGRVALDSVSGDVIVAAGDVERLALSTVSGDATLRAGLATGGSIKADTVSGNLSLTVPAATSARVAIGSFSGGIRSAVGKVVSEEYGPGKHLNARMGAGQGEIRLESFSGNTTLSTE